MRLLVTGANGLLGSNVVAAALEWGWDVRGTYHSTAPDFDIPLERFDLADLAAIDDLVASADPDAVVNCAAKTDVDACEREPERARRINAEAPEELAETCRARDAQLVHVSTDYVFDGTGDTPYSEADQPHPIQVYGESKLAGDRRVQEAHPEGGLIPRLSFVWGIHRARSELTGFPRWVVSSLQRGERVPLFTDQRITPTRAGQAAATILSLLESRESGVFNVTCSSCVSPFTFGMELAETLGLDADRLQRGSSSDVDRDASRPGFSCLDVTKLETLLGRSQPTLTEDIEAVAPRVDIEE